MSYQAEVKVILTEKAHHFVDAQKLGAQVHTDEEEWVSRGAQPCSCLCIAL